MLEWNARFDQVLPATDILTAFTVAPDGTSYFVYQTAANDPRLRKQGADGSLVWDHPFAPAVQNPVALALAVDANGNIAVAGSAASDDQLLVTKYDSTGLEMWHHTLDVLDVRDDLPTWVSFDESGHIYVVVTLRSAASVSTVFRTTKYFPDGQPAWTVPYAGPNGGLNYAYDAELTPDGGIVVAGLSRGQGSDDYEFDFTVVKYNGNGQGEWVNRHAPWSGDFPGIDDGASVAVDAAGSVYGCSSSWLFGFFRRGLLAKYAPDGEQEWLIYDRELAWPAGLTVDPAGLPLVTGGDPARENILTAKYSPQGERTFLATHAGLPGGTDSGSQVRSDSLGNAIVLAYFRISNGLTELFTIRYDSSGQELAFHHHDDLLVHLPGWPPRVDFGLDSGGNSYLGATDGQGVQRDAVTLSYSAAGPRWVQRLTGSDHTWDSVAALAVDTSGSTYVGGTRQFYDMPTRALLIKYDVQGALAWVHQGSDWGSIGFVQIDPAGSVYVSGSGSLAHLLPDGTIQWTSTIDDVDSVTGLQADDAGALVTGYHREYHAGNLLSDYALARLDSSGTTLWSARYDGPAHGNDYLDAAVLDSFGNSYVTGASFATDSDYDIVSIKYGSDGTPLWVRRWQSPGSAVDRGKQVAVDSHGNVIVAGHTTASGVSSLVTVKYDPDGNLLWQASFDTGLSPPEVALSIDSSDSITVGRLGPFGASDGDVLTAKYASDGAREWLRAYNGPPEAQGVARRIAIDAHGNVYLAGDIGGPNQPILPGIWRYGDGSLRWLARHEWLNVPGGIHMRLGSQGQIHVSGRSNSPETYADIATMRFSATPPSCPGGETCYFGDLDSDCDVDFSDLTTFLTHFGDVLESGTAPTNGDLDFDGGVGLRDLTLFLSLFGQTCR